jgi:Curli production assembly/transport component CsgG
MRQQMRGLGFLLLSAVVITSTAGAQGITDMKPGEGGSVVKGSAGPSGSQGGTDLARCDKPMGAVAVVEPQSYVAQALARYQLGSPVSLIRLMVQQSNCFLVVERGLGMKNMMQERALADAGQLRENSNIGAGQMVSADYVLTPAVVFSDNNAGGVGGGLGAIGPLFGRGGRFVGAIGGGIAGGLKFKEAQTSMLVTDARSGIQVAAAEGSASKSDFNIGGFLGGFGGGGGGALGLGGYSNTAEGKIIAASFADNYNKVVQAVRGNPSLQRNVGTLAEEAAAGGKTRAGAVYNEGDVLRPKLATIRLLSKPSDESPVITTLTKADEMIFLGKEQEGYLQVESGKGSGWVKKVLIAR